MRSFHNRFHAGQVLARRLIQYRGLDNLLVLALPRGGVPVGFEVARRLLAPLDLYLVRKLGMPGYWELAMGALAMGGVRVVNQEVVDAFQIPASIIDGVAEIEQVELDRQQRVLRGSRPLPTIADHKVILVDDGLATGSTMRAAVRSVRQYGPERIIVAVPVGVAEACAELHKEADDVICARTPHDFVSVSSHYRDFTAPSDNLVQRLLQEAACGKSNNLAIPGSEMPFPTTNQWEAHHGDISC